MTDAAQRAQNIDTIGTDGNQKTATHALATITQICYVATTLCTVAALCTWWLSLFGFVKATEAIAVIQILFIIVNLQKMY
ncbi:MAG: hypothetical protein E7517_02850 [Ruminococcaceae bacterium]|nr:hypothetical protein [Oscillospiraceae bacterium]